MAMPPGVSSDGMVKVAFVPTIAGIEAATPKILLNELTAVGAVDLTCYMTAAIDPTASENSSTDWRFCTKQVFEDFGTVTYGFNELNYVYDAQLATDTGSINKAYTVLKKGIRGFLVVAWGKDAETDWKLGDIVDVYPVRLGVQRKMAPEQNSKLKIAQKPYVLGKVQEDLAVAAS